MKNRNRRQKGFTIAEVLIVLGMLSIVLSIGMLGVAHYKAALKLTEMDSVAKEIFVVAQNHMLMAKDSNEWKNIGQVHKDNLETYLGRRMEIQPSDYPSNEVWGQEKQDYRYLVYNSGSSINTLENTLLEIILPYGSIDEEIRSKGSYIIEYDYATGTVYGVFYTDSSQTISYENDIMGALGLNNNKGRENSNEGKEARKKYKNDKGQMIIGYYGGAVTNDFKVTSLDPIEMEVHNGDTLAITIKDKNYSKMIDGIKAHTKILLTVTGEESKMSETYRLVAEEGSKEAYNRQASWWQFAEDQGVGIYTLVLDDITKQGGHFADLFPSLIPGENIIIQAEAFSEEVLCTPVKAQVYTNSLFETNYNYEENGKQHAKVSISSIRHLQNLSPEVSNLPTETAIGGIQQKVDKVIRKVDQTKDLDWNTFTPNEQMGDIRIYSYDEIIANQKELAHNKFYGISNLALVSYEGHGYKLSHFNIQENESGNAGLFSQIGSDIIPQDFTVTNLILDTFNSVSSKDGNAGSLIGEVKTKGTFKGNNISVTNTTVKALNNGIAGGLVGKMSNGTLQQCRIYLTDGEDSLGNKKTASEKYELGAYHGDSKAEGTQYMIASSGGIAGGLVGKVESVEITDTFAAVPVWANNNGVAGGLVGESQGITDQKVTITNSYTGGYTKEGAYSECYNVSALGTSGVAGGFIGRVVGGITTVQNSYATASVYGNSVGGFIGKVEQGTNTYENCYATGSAVGVSEASQRGGFIGEAKTEAGLTIKACYTLKQSNKDLTATISGVENLDYDSLIQKTRTDDTLKVEQYAYDVALQTEVYPFGTVTNIGAKDTQSTGVHYGDWPVKSNEVSVGGDIGVLYYEVVEDKLYYHGYFATYSERESETNYREIMTPGAGLTNGLLTTPGKYVSEDGYIIAVPKETNLNDIAVTASNTRGYLEGERWKLSECVEVFSKNHLIDLPGFDVYYFKRELNNYESAYLMLGQNTSESYPVLGQYASFYFNHYFGDTVAPERPTEQKVYIRSARQLANLNKLNWSHANNKEIEFLQNIDISYEDIAFTKNGINIVYEYQTLGQIYSDYTVQQYKAGDELKGYVIKGLKIPLFGRVESSSTIRGVTLVNSQVKENASLAITNVGIIESCSVHAANQGPEGYASVTIEKQYGAAGFVQTNGDGGGNGIIRNSYFVGTVTGETSSGFVDTNYGTIENSYANVIVRGNTSASGFVRSNINGIIKNSFVTGSVVSTGDYGKAYGFMELGSEGIMESCYSALFQLSGHQIYRFGPGRGLYYSNTVWLNNTYIEGEVQLGEPNDLRERGTGVSYETMIQKANHPKTYAYRSHYENIDEINLTYPFELLSTEDAYLKMAFWGDWPEEDLTREIGLIYYEKTDSGLYYKGYFAKYRLDESGEEYTEIKPVGSPHKSPKEKGYIILVREGTNKENVGMRIRKNPNDNSSGEPTTLDQLDPRLVEREVLRIPGFEAYYFNSDPGNGKVPDISWIVIDERVNHGFFSSK